MGKKKGKPQNVTKSHKKDSAQGCDAVDQKILQIELTQPSSTDQEIAVQVGLSREQVNRRRNSEPYEQAREEIFEEAMGKISSVLSKAADVIVGALTSQDESIRVDVAKTVLFSENVLKKGQSRTEITGRDGGPVTLESLVAGRIPPEDDGSTGNHY